ncbi:MAG: hypothetical protein HYZ36_02575 [Pedosphaera parvula]|nr:hypothetical protein [Verrucomicrobiota bacterium]MBI3191522.1 hypothetical protein [Pedosphaera parvula]
MNFELKTLSKDAIPAALEKAMRYRLLNEPAAAESICLDIVRADPDHQQALVILLLAMTDRFSDGYAVGDTQINEVLGKLRDEYERLYYRGIVCERRGKATLKQGSPGAGFAAFEWFQEALGWYEKAERIRPAGNDDALLRWNACARMIMQNHLTARPAEPIEPSLE